MADINKLSRRGGKIYVLITSYQHGLGEAVEVEAEYSQPYIRLEKRWKAKV